LLLLAVAIFVTYAVVQTYDSFVATNLQRSAPGIEEFDMAARIEPLLTVADLDACPDDNNRYELIEGELFVSRAPGIPHQRVLNNLQFAFGTYLKNNPIGIVVPGAGAIFSNYDAVIPDLAFVSNERWSDIVSNDRFNAAPDLVIEVMSPGKENRDRDLLVKRQLYAKYGVVEYWIVDPENHLVQVYRLRDSRLESAATLRNGDEMTTSLLPGFRMGVNSVFAL
jgi:Uma2 family endonuclease